MKPVQRVGCLLDLLVGLRPLDRQHVAVDAGQRHGQLDEHAKRTDRPRRDGVEVLAETLPVAAGRLRRRMRGAR